MRTKIVLKLPSFACNRLPFLIASASCDLHPDKVDFVGRNSKWLQAPATNAFGPVNRQQIVDIVVLIPNILPYILARQRPSYAIPMTAENDRWEICWNKFHAFFCYGCAINVDFVVFYSGIFVMPLFWQEKILWQVECNSSSEVSFCGPNIESTVH